MKSILGALLVGAFLLSSCQGQAAEPKAAPQSTAPANPDATLPPMPAMANEFTREGASVFVRHYVEVLEYADATGDTNELEQLSRKECEGCNEYINYFLELYRNGGFSSGSDWSTGVNEIRYQDRPGLESLVTTKLWISKSRGREKSYGEVKEFSSSIDTVTFGLIFDNGWTMNQFAFGGLN